MAVAEMVEAAPETSQILAELDAVGMRFGATVALAAVSLTIRRGEIVTVIGPNGAGKSTLLRILLGLLPPSSGSVRLRPGLRIGYVPQRVAIDETLPLTVRRFLSLAIDRRAAAEAGDLAAALAEVGAPGLIASPVQGLSGGEMQRVLVARALLRAPDLLVLDEPAQGVDIIGQAELFALIRRIRDRRHCGVLLVSHDLHLVMAATDHVVCLNHHICCSGHPEAVTRDPAYRAMFGTAADALAIYAHHHDHTHGSHGEEIAGSPTQG
jgi:zinc transport system ATP-binding protein